MKAEKHAIFSASAEEGGTLVSDGAKLKSRKRGMLNSALVTRAGACAHYMSLGCRLSSVTCQI